MMKKVANFVEQVMSLSRSKFSIWIPKNHLPRAHGLQNLNPNPKTLNPEYLPTSSRMQAVAVSLSLMVNDLDPNIDAEKWANADPANDQVSRGTNMHPFLFASVQTCIHFFMLWYKQASIFVGVEQTPIRPTDQIIDCVVRFHLRICPRVQSLRHFPFFSLISFLFCFGGGGWRGYRTRRRRRKERGASSLGQVRPASESLAKFVTQSQKHAHARPNPKP
jgi:hypothetical protein